MLLIILIFELIKFSANDLIVIPIITGTVTTKAIFIAIPVKVISFEILVTPNISADVKTINGTEIILIKLPTAVREIDNATSPFANLVKTFEVTPPGAAAIIIKPSAISIGNLNMIVMIYATIGKRISWQTIPIKKSLGVLITLVKSLIDRPRPKPNIINAKC